jgi:uncharacterized protein GlcG (DUF336 family)
MPDSITAPAVATLSIETVSGAAVRCLVDAAEEKARAIGVPCTVAVCDHAGILKGYSRMDGAALVSVQIAQDKAYTAVGFGLATHEWHDFIKDDAPLAAGAPSGVARLIVFGGGYPVKARTGALIGGIGVSGGHWTQDMQVAEAALAALARWTK